MRTLSKEEINEILRLHEMWCNDEEGGARADFSNTDLRGFDFSGKILRGADFRGSCLRDVDFIGSDLRGADFDYSVFPLWCGGSRFKADMKLARQMLAHLCSLDIVDADDEYKEALAIMIKIAAKSHHAEDLGIID